MASSLSALSGSLLPEQDSGSSRRNVSTKVMPSVSVFHILLIASASFEADIVTAWKAEATFMEVAFDCMLAHYTLDKHHDLLDCVRAGVFQAVFILPTSSTWTSAHHHCNAGYSLGVGPNLWDSQLSALTHHPVYAKTADRWRYLRSLQNRHFDANLNEWPS